MVPKIHFIITTSLIDNDFENRKKDYINSLNTLFNEISKYNNLETLFYIVENNGARHTFLNEIVQNNSHLKINLIYTNHNQINTSNKGLKEFLDIAFILHQFKENINDNDIFVKLTGRYRIGEDCTFLNILYNQYSNYDAFIRSGAFMYPFQQKNERDNFDCITGLFAIRVKYFRNNCDYFIQNIHSYDWIEWVIMMIIQINIPNNRIKLYDYLGLWIKTAYMKEYQLF